MPQPAEVNAAADQLVGAFAAAVAELHAALADAKGSDTRRLARVLRDLDRIMGRLDATIRTHVAETMPAVWARGAVDTGLGFAWDQAATEAVQALAAQDYSELLDVTRHVAEQTKRAAERVQPAPAPGYRPETLQVLFGTSAP